MLEVRDSVDPLELVSVSWLITEPELVVVTVPEMVVWPPVGLVEWV